jgi:hypothetical protein
MVGVGVMLADEIHNRGARSGKNKSEVKSQIYTPYICRLLFSLKNIYKK